MTEEALIKRKLLLNGAGAGDGKKLQIFIKQLNEWLYSDQTPIEINATYNKLLAQLHCLQLNKRKFNLSNTCNTNQKAKYRNIQIAFEKRMDMIKKDIQSQQNLLKRAKVVKKNTVECELLVQAVKQQSDRQKLMQTIESLKKEIVELDEKRGYFGSKLNSKVKQCHVLSTSANVIREGLKANEESVSSSNSELSEFDLLVTLK